MILHCTRQTHMLERPASFWGYHIVRLAHRMPVWPLLIVAAVSLLVLGIYFVRSSLVIVDEINLSSGLHRSTRVLYGFQIGTPSPARPITTHTPWPQSSAPDKWIAVKRSLEFSRGTLLNPDDRHDILSSIGHLEHFLLRRGAAADARVNAVRILIEFAVDHDPIYFGPIGDSDRLYVYSNTLDPVQVWP